MKHLIPFLIASSALGQFSSLPYTYTQSPAVWEGLFQQAKTSRVHGLIFGDSQETCPQGHGDHYIIDLHKHLARFYGGCGTTPWSQAGISFGSGQPWGEWLARGSAAAPGGTYLGFPLPWIPAGMRGFVVSAMNGSNVNNNQLYGWLLTLDRTAAFTPPATAASGLWFDTFAGVYLEVMARTAPGSSEIQVKVSYSAGSTPTYYGTPIATVNTSMGLNTTEGEVRTQVLGPFTGPAGCTFHAEIGGNDPAHTATLLSARYLSVADQRGMVFTDLAEGGYRAASYLSLSPDSGPAIAALHGDFAVITYGANEAGNGIPLTEYHDTVVSLIAMIRANTSPTFPVMIVPDVYRILPSEYLPILDGLGQAAYDIAQADPYVLFLNSRRLTDEAGWNAGGYSGFLEDFAHYNATGAEVKANLEAHTLLQTFACIPDFNGDGFVDFFDMDDFIGAYTTGNTRADVNIDGFTDFFDYDAFVTMFESGC